MDDRRPMPGAGDCDADPERLCPLDFRTGRASLAAAEGARSGDWLVVANVAARGGGGGGLSDMASIVFTASSSRFRSYVLRRSMLCSVQCYSSAARSAGGHYYMSCNR